MVPLRSCLLAAALVLPALSSAQVVGYAVNSDDTRDADQLLRVDLETGSYQFLGALPDVFADVEGLAFDRDGNLFGVDSGSKTLIRVSLTTGSALSVNGSELNLGFPPTSVLDFGMTATCSGELLLVAEQTGSLYRLDRDTGMASLIGVSGGLGDAMTAIASYGEDTYAMADNGRFYRVDVETATASLIGTISDFEFTDAGMAFDDQGRLWAITSDFSSDPSRIIRINPSTAEIEAVSQTRTGIESLAIAPPGNCEVLGGGPPPNEPEVVPVNSPWMLALLGSILLLVGGYRARRQTR